MHKLWELLLGRTARNSAITVGSNILYGLLIITFTILVSRTLGPEQFGLFSIAMAFFGLSFDVLSLGTSHALVRFTSIHLAKNDRKTAHQFARIIFLLRLCQTIGLLTISVVVARFISTYIYHDQRLFVILVISFALAGGNLLIDFFSNLLQGHERFIPAALVIFINAAIRILGLSVLLVTHQLSLITAMIAFAIGPWIGALCGFIVSPKHYLSIESDPAIIPHLFHFAKWMAIWSLTATLAGRVDVLILGKLTSAYQTGIYAAASRLATGFILIGSAYASVLTPKISRLMHHQTDLRRQISRIATSIIGIVITMVVAICVAPIVIPLVFGEKYTSSVIIFQVLTIGCMFFIASIPANVSLVSLGFSKFIGVSAIIQLAILVVVSIYLVPIFGSLGAAIALSCAYAFTAVASTVYASKHINSTSFALQSK